MNCALLIGLALNANTQADPEILRLDNPWGSVRGECEHNVLGIKVREYIEHNTSLLVIEEGAGINKLGIELKLIEW